MKKNQIFFLGELGLPISDEEFLYKANELYREAFPSAELLTGAERLVKHLAAHDIPMGKNDIYFLNEFLFECFQQLARVLRMNYTH
jgi:hypothetical protein